MIPVFISMGFARFVTARQSPAEIAGKALHRGTAIGGSDFMLGMTNKKNRSWTDPTEYILPSAQEDLIRRGLFERGDNGSLLITPKGRAYIRRHSL